MNEWIEWYGGECPVGPDVLVDVQLRCERESDLHHCGATTAGALRWSCANRSSDIVAYRVHQAGQVEPQDSHMQEREAFEAWSESLPTFELPMLQKRADGKYMNAFVDASWQGWLARSRMQERVR